MPKKSINVSIDESVLVKVDEILEKNTHLNRSAFVQYCVTKVVKELRGKEFVDVEV